MTFLKNPRLIVHNLLPLTSYFKFSIHIKLKKNCVPIKKNPRTVSMASSISSPYFSVIIIHTTGAPKAQLQRGFLFCEFV